MTVRERVIASRLIQKIEACDGYAKQIGLTYSFEHPKPNINCANKKEKKKQ